MSLTASRRFSSRRALFVAVAAALASVLSPAAYADPLLSGTAGTGTNTFYFTLDFRDFPAPQSYAFAYKSNASSLTFEQILQGLTGIPTFTTRIGAPGMFGASLNGLGFAGKEKYNTFASTVPGAPNNSGEPYGYFSQWNSPTGLDGSWISDSVGISFQPINAGQYAGASWVADYRAVTSDTTPRPRTPQVAVAAAPEPSALALLTIFGSGTGASVLVRRRKRKND